MLERGFEGVPHPIGHCIRVAPGSKRIRVVCYTGQVANAFAVQLPPPAGPENLSSPGIGASVKNIFGDAIAMRAQMDVAFAHVRQT